MKKIIYLFASTILMLSCVTSQNTVRYTVASQTADCVGVAPQKCLLVKKGNANEWQNFYSSIEGFSHEKGNEYVLEVREEKLENVPADASSIKYILVKEISKTAKTSENLPAAAITKTEIQWVGKVVGIEKADVGKGGAQGKFAVTVVKVAVTSTGYDKFKAGDVIHCELVASPTVTPEVGREYVFKAKNIHPAHAKGVYMLDTNVQDLI